MIPFGTHIAAAAIAGVLAFGAAWQMQAWRYGEQITTIKLEHAEAAASSAKSALKLTEHYRDNADAAVRKAEARARSSSRSLWPSPTSSTSRAGPAVCRMSSVRFATVVASGYTGCSA